MVSIHACSEGPVDRSAEGAGNETRLASYLEHLGSSLGHADRRAPFGSYCKGLILPGERKSVEPIAARVEPSRVQGAHQSLHHFVANADWSQEVLLRQVRTFVLPAIEKSGGVRAWIVDDTGFPKKGVHSVGVARQYCGQLGKNGRRTKARRPNTGSRPWRRIQPWRPRPKGSAPKSRTRAVGTRPPTPRDRRPE